MHRTFFLFLLAIASTSFADEPDSTKPGESNIHVECHGKLRHGIASIGGETTGTTITFQGVTWELKLRDDESRKLAEKFNKKPVVVVGKLSHIRGVEIPSRWIVVVEKLAERQDDSKQESATASIVGKLKNLGKSDGDQFQSILDSGGISWLLDLDDNRALPSKVKSLDGQPVLVTGQIIRETSSKRASPLRLKVSKLEPAASEKQRP